MRSTEIQNGRLFFAIPKFHGQTRPRQLYFKTRAGTGVDRIYQISNQETAYRSGCWYDGDESTIVEWLNVEYVTIQEEG